MRQDVLIRESGRKYSPLAWVSYRYNNGLTLTQRRTITGYLFIAPFILGFVLWFLLPAVVAANLTFQKWNLITPAHYIGTANIERLFDDPLLIKSLKATFLYTIISVPVGVMFALFLALLLNSPVRGIALFRTAYFLPSIVPLVASAVLWAWMFNTEFGLVNFIVRELGWSKVLWLQKPKWAMAAFIVISTWGTTGGPMIIFLAGLQGIPEVYYEAAEIDGAGRFSKLRYITLPLLSPLIFFNSIIGLINSFQVFVQALLITNGGPQNSTLFLVVYIYRTAFRSQNMGYAATISWVLFIILLVLSFITFRYLGSRVYYENERD